MPRARAEDRAGHSAGLLVYRRIASGLEVFVGHMGGPFWARKDDAAWSIPKGLIEPGDEPLATARREFEEEIGMPAPVTEVLELGDFRYRSGKRLTVFAAAADAEVAFVRSNEFELEWPPRSGRMQRFREVDRAVWASVPDARRMLVVGQVPALEALLEHLGIT